ncbi:MAG: hypothetical protein KZQ77_16005 [Candidatus Thiodiazotropha sp. (ex Notomyrtea botanica)]|nr:hypothetical protein [Candidatus Thiodiazotropha sp. (ex Notomyrtea botanica)]
MKKIITLSLFALLFPGIASSDMVDEAAEAMCKCGVPPRSACMDEIAKQFPEIDRNPALQDRVMDKYQHDCVAKMGARGGSRMNIPGLPAAAGGSAGTANKPLQTSSDCSTSTFSVAIPKGWNCRKVGANTQDVTLYAYGNRLNVSLGKSQGKTSCSVIPICKRDKHELSSRFESTRFTNPMIGSHEYAGHYKKDSAFKLTITSNSKPTDAQLNEIKAILESFKKR